MHALRWNCPVYLTQIQLVVECREGHVYPIGLAMDDVPFPGADGYISSLGADCYLYEPSGMVESFVRARLQIPEKQRVIFEIPLSTGRLISERSLSLHLL